MAPATPRTPTETLAITAPAARTLRVEVTLLRSLQSVHVGPALRLARQEGDDGDDVATGRGLDVSLSPGVLLPDRLATASDLWRRPSTADVALNVGRQFTRRDRWDASTDAAARGGGVTQSLAWTHTLSARADGFASWGSRDPLDPGPYRALQVGADVWPVRRLPLRVEGGVSALPGSPRLLLGVGYSPR